MVRLWRQNHSEGFLEADSFLSRVSRQIHNLVWLKTEIHIFFYGTCYVILSFICVVGSVVDSGRLSGRVRVRAPTHQKSWCTLSHFGLLEGHFRGHFIMSCSLKGQPRRHFITFCPPEGYFWGHFIMSSTLEVHLLWALYHVLSTERAPERALYHILSTRRALYHVLSTKRTP